jgi:tRNA(fMet)-specific endonuclease VapC
MKPIFLDTNAYTKLLFHDSSVFQAIALSEAVYFSVIVLGELHSGFQYGSKTDENIRLLKQFLSAPTVHIYSVTHETAVIYGDLKAQLLRNGTPIPSNDIWIAAQVIEADAQLVTFDTHFQTIPTVSLWS